MYGLSILLAVILEIQVSARLIRSFIGCETFRSNTIRKQISLRMRTSISGPYLLNFWIISSLLWSNSTGMLPNQIVLVGSDCAGGERLGSGPFKNSAMLGPS